MKSEGLTFFNEFLDMGAEQFKVKMFKVVVFFADNNIFVLKILTVECYEFKQELIN